MQRDLPGYHRPVRVLQVTTQRPGWTGSGTTVEALARECAAAGVETSLLCGHPAGEDAPAVPGIEASRLHLVRFGQGGDLPFPVAGMSDVMPYESSVWSQLGEEHLALWENAWRRALERALHEERPDVLHVHHAWWGAALALELAGEVPVVLHGHGTGLRQLELAPRIGDRVRGALEGAAGLCALHPDHADRYHATLGIPRERIAIVGAGCSLDAFQPRGAEAEAGSLLFAGKWSEAKGLGPLLDAFGRLHARQPHLRLRIAGGGAGEEADRLRQRMERQAGVEVLGRLPLEGLVQAMQAASVFVLPSLYEGLPLVLVEAAATGARLVSTALPGVRFCADAGLADRLEQVPMPALEGPDRLAEGAQGAFVQDLEQSLERALGAGPPPPLEQATREAFSWTGVAGRVREVWSRVTS